MKNFNHLHVMAVKGICFDGGPVPFLILPYMANGSLLSYIRKEQSNLVVMIGTNINGEELPQVKKCNQGLSYQLLYSYNTLTVSHTVS